MSRAMFDRLPHSQLAPSLVRLRRSSQQPHIGRTYVEGCRPCCAYSRLALGPIINAGIVRGAGRRYRREAHLNTTSVARPCLASWGPFLSICEPGHTSGLWKINDLADTAAYRYAPQVRTPEERSACEYRHLRPVGCVLRTAYPTVPYGPICGPQQPASVTPRPPQPLRTFDPCASSLPSPCTARQLAHLQRLTHSSCARLREKRSTTL